MAQGGTGIGFFLVLALALIGPFAVGSLAGVGFTRLIKRRGWRPQVISVWPISIMFGTLAYAFAPALPFTVFAIVELEPLAFLAGLAVALFYTWPIWLLTGPVLFIYVAYLKNRQKWLRDSTVVYLSAISLASECVFLFWFWH